MYQNENQTRQLLNKRGKTKVSQGKYDPYDPCWVSLFQLNSDKFMDFFNTSPS